MTLTETIKAIKKEVADNGTEKQKDKLRNMSIEKIDEMVHVAQSMGTSSAISMYL